MIKFKFYKKIIASALIISMIAGTPQIATYASENEDIATEITEEATAYSEEETTESLTEDITETDIASEENSTEESTTEVSTEDIGLETEQAIAADYTDAKNKFIDICREKDVMALIYLADSVSVYDSITLPVSGNGIGSVVYGNVVANLESAHTVYLHDVLIGTDDIFYYASFYVDDTEMYGYIDGYYLAHSDEDWLEWEKTYLPDTLLEQVSLEAYEDIEKFPAAIQAKLMDIKQKHPNWVFVPQNTNLDFQTAVANEVGDRSWIWKNTANQNAGFLGNPTSQANWCYATKTAVEYYMNPYNYLDETHIFAFEQLTYNSSYHTEAAIQSFLSKTFMSGEMPGENMTYAKAFYEIGKSRKLSPTHLASRVYQEQGKGTSALISGTYKGYEGYYNYFNVGATGNTETDVIVNGLKKAKDMGWNTRYKSISGGAATIGNNYILKGQDTIYLEKFDVAPNQELYTHQYMQNIQAPWTESSTTRSTYSGSGSLDSPFVFKITMYNNMPLPYVDIWIDNVDITNASDAANMLTGQSLGLILDVSPKSTTESIEAIWTSSNPAVVSVEDGTIVAHKAGSANISVTVGKDKITTSIPVTVKDCTVTFYKADHKTVADTKKVAYGYILDDYDFPSDSSLGQTDGSCIFEGWYTAPDSGMRYTEGMIVANAELKLYPVYKKRGQGFYVTGVSDQTYTGAILKPAITVYDSYTYNYDSGSDGLYHAELIPGKDYTVSYKNTKLPGSADNENEALRPTIIITGKGNYSGVQKIYFNINAKSLRGNDITVDEILVARTGKAQKVAPVVYRDGKKLKRNTDYTVTWPSTVSGSYTNAGKWPITITGKGGYTDSITIYETITNLVPMSKVTVKGLTAQTYDGTQKTPGFSVYYGKTPLTASTDNGKTGDYIITYGENTAIGTGTITIIAVNGSNYAGKKTVTFKINGTPITKAKIRAKDTSSGQSITGIDPKTYNSRPEEMLQYNYELYVGDKILTQSKDGGKTGDYIVSYQKETSAGTAIILFTGINGYSGVLKKTYKILPLALPSIKENGGLQICMPADYTAKDVVNSSTGMISSPDGTYYTNGNITYTYRKGGVKPVPLVFYNGIELVNGKDFRITYSNNTKINDGSNEVKLPTMTIIGKGCFKDKVSINFTIAERNLSTITKASPDNMTAKDVTFSTRRGGYKSVPVIYDISGVKLAAGTDYEKELIYTYTYDTDLDGDGINEKTAGTPVELTDVVPANTTLTVTATGKGCYMNDTISCNYRITQMPISSAKIKATISPQSYTGRQITPAKPAITITYNGEPISYEDYDIISYGENTKKGTGTVVIKGRGNYGGTRTIKFSIIPKLFIW